MQENNNANNFLRKAPEQNSERILSPETEEERIIKLVPSSRADSEMGPSANEILNQ